MSIAGGALETVNQFLSKVTSAGAEFPYWHDATARWALTRWTLVDVEHLPPEGFDFSWRVGDQVRNIHIKNLNDKPGVWLQVLQPQPEKP